MDRIKRKVAVLRTMNRSLRTKSVVIVCCKSPRPGSQQRKERI